MHSIHLDLEVVSRMAEELLQLIREDHPIGAESCSLMIPLGIFHPKSMNPSLRRPKSDPLERKGNSHFFAEVKPQDRSLDEPKEDETSQPNERTQFPIP